MATPHLDQLIRINGEANTAKDNNARVPTLTVQSVEFIAGSCVSALPAKKPRAMVGKVREGKVAIPLTTTASADETTPGFQTETLTGQEPPASGCSSIGLVTQSGSPIVPAKIAQVAESGAAAEIYAQAAARSEIQPGNTLGTDASLTRGARKAPRRSRGQ